MGTCGICLRPDFLRTCFRTFRVSVFVVKGVTEVEGLYVIVNPRRPIKIIES